MQPIWVRINRLKYSFGKQELSWIVKMLEQLEFKSWNGFLYNQKYGLLIRRRICSSQPKYIAFKVRESSYIFRRNCGWRGIGKLSWLVVSFRTIGLQLTQVQILHLSAENCLKKIWHKLIKFNKINIQSHPNFERWINLIDQELSNYIRCY